MLAWTWFRFDDLGVNNLYDALQLRAQVFILEQGPYQDLDGLDRTAWHLLGRNDDGNLVAYLRIVDPGVKFAEPAIGRVVTALSIRGQGIGRALMGEGLARCGHLWPRQPVRISAQARLRGFYRSLGFEAIGQEYLEDDIPHIEMLRSP
jgi:ElaA protein